jgi:5-formyltetrahydrofolate cyclo-ligase
MTSTSDLTTKYKNAQRKAVMARRDSLSEEQRMQASEQLCQRAFEWLITLPSWENVAGYWPIRSEMDPRPLMQALAKAGKSLALPAIHEDELVFRMWSFDEALVNGAWNLQEPVATALCVIPDVVLVPLVAFDAHANRLGYGKGYYDRALEKLRFHQKIYAIGLAFECQREAHIVTQSHDQRLDSIITPDEIVHVSFG